MDKNSFILTLLNLKGWGAKKVFSYVKEHEFNYDKCVTGLLVKLNDEEKVTFKKELLNSKLELKKNYDVGIKCTNILDDCFPSKLYNSTQKCVFLYYVGDISLLSQESVLVIGTRNPNEAFLRKGEKLTKYLVENQFVIVSGLALGCDTIAHKTCIEAGGKTIAVLPSPCDNIQPTSNKILANNILISGGLLISEYGSGAAISKYNYPKRDIVQSLISTTTIIIEATDKSGTMIATEKSIKDGKNVYAIKGNDLSIVKNYIDVESTDEMNNLIKSIRI